MANFEIGGQQVLKNKRKSLKNIVKLSVPYNYRYNFRLSTGLKKNPSKHGAQGMNENIKNEGLQDKKLFQGFTKD